MRCKRTNKTTLKIALFLPFFQSPRRATRNVRVRTAISRTRIPPSATCSTTVLMVNPQKSPVLQDYISTSTRALACGRNLQDAPGAANPKVSVMVQESECYGPGKGVLWSRKGGVVVQERGRCGPGEGALWIRKGSVLVQETECCGPGKGVLWSRKGGVVVQERGVLWTRCCSVGKLGVQFTRSGLFWVLRNVEL
jgi:hypothetical protein